MSGLFNTLNTASKGMMASQTSLHTTGHNLANANTEGYSRQRVELKADLPYSLGGVGQLGTGVKMESVIRVVNDYVSKQIRQENGTMRQFSAKHEIMEQIEVIFNEPSDTSLSSDIGKMFDAWIELSKNPEMQTSKTIVVEQSKSLADTYNHMMTQLGDLEEESHGMIGKNIEDFNAILGKIESLNRQIFNIAVKGSVPNDLLDQRDLMLKELSGFMDINAEADKYGRASVSIGKGEDRVDLIVAGKSPVQLEYNKEAGHIGVKDSDPEKTIEIKSGEIKGRQAALEELASRKQEMKDFAAGLAEAINTIHKAGIEEPDDQIDIFIYDKESGDLRVNEELLEDSSLIITGRTADSPDGDSSRALLISNLRNLNIKFGQDGPGDIVEINEDGDLVLRGQKEGNTIGGYYNDIVTSVGIAQEHAENMVINQEVLLEQLELRRESVSGVSIDEEVTNLIKFSSAFDANARVIQTLSDMLDTLIHRTGV